MAKPRVFVSSTYYDLRHIRNAIESFIDSMGYEAILFESGDIPFRHDEPVDESCYDEIQNCHMLVLIVGGRYGSPTSSERLADPEFIDYKKFNSITRKEYETAREKDIPVFIFVESGVHAEYQTYKKNRDNDTIVYSHVDNINVFALLDEILQQRRNNFVKEFYKADDITSWLRDQWAGLFAEYLAKKSRETVLKDLSTQIAELRDVSSVLRKYNEAIITQLQPEKSRQLISKQDRRIRFAKAKRLADEPMMKFLTTEYQLEKSPLSFLRYLQLSENLKDYLKRIGLSDKHISNFLTEHATMANKDYEEFKLKYIYSDDDRTPDGDSD
ncbi:MAG: DUF4062 domain-containing protein [Rhodospirillales bacterium]